MAARISPASQWSLDIVDLRKLASSDLTDLLGEEIAVWREELEWDFTKSADLVCRFMDLRALNGAALLEDGEVAGYAYYVLDDHKALIGDVYVRRAHRTVDRENALIQWVLRVIGAYPSVERVEAQVMTLLSEPRRRPGPGRFSSYDRNFMRLDMAAASLGESPVRKLSYIERWSDLYQDAAARLIAAAYAGHVDALINDQYENASGARRFLHNVVQHPGCGVFCREASYAAFDGASGNLCGVSLASIVAPGSGHITQICVSPDVRGAGVGHALLRQSLLSLGKVGCHSTSLTVTAANEGAVRLYERVGFRTVKRFAAFVWTPPFTGSRRDLRSA